MRRPNARSKPRLDNFAVWTKAIRRAFLRAKEREKMHVPLRPAETSDGVLRSRCYKYFRLLKQAKLLDGLIAHVKSRDPGKWHRHPGERVVWVLRLIETGESDLLTPSRRSRMAIELNFAEACGIHSQRLLGFLYESGSHELLKDEATKKVRPSWTEAYRKGG